MTATTAVRLQELVVRSADRHLVGPVSFDLPRGATLGLRGPSGSGKSTTLRALVGLLPPMLDVRGSVEVLGCDVLASGADLARLADLYDREELVRWLGAPSVPPAELVDRWARVHALDGRCGCWAVERPDGVVAGTVLFKPLPAGVGEIEVGWHLHPDSWGHGYATEAARAVVERGFAAGVPEVYAVVRPGNEASAAVCRRLGMTPLGRLRRWYDVELDAFRLMAPVVVD